MTFDSFRDEYPILLDHFESEFMGNKDPLAFWGAILVITRFGQAYYRASESASDNEPIMMPKWVLDELIRISEALFSLSNPAVRYSETLQKILKMSGHGRRTAERKRIGAKIALAAKKLFIQGNKRSQDLLTLEGKFDLNSRELARIYDSAKKKYRGTQKEIKERAELLAKIEELEKELTELNAKGTPKGILAL